MLTIEDVCSFINKKLTEISENPTSSAEGIRMQRNIQVNINKLNSMIYRFIGTTSTNDINIALKMVGNINNSLPISLVLRSDNEKTISANKSYSNKNQNTKPGKLSSTIRRKRYRPRNKNGNGNKMVAKTNHIKKI
ncbi:hypothetical protein LY90DRAFT_501781 [Neocallimastix californiae]|uniref:Uncharacterized protein n=1 Tax=Neocallimastix californiae TaxID=1754190 RepID=A0A1Y2EXW4_9FUNG|nr:hypothetical protein LY90DRAFT_501781 [Neocallimastix californiae]|eukprot:ORY76461.1 hypothetical protein LY90DRAFT_501781 [Neocallimastix californiae]